MNSFSEIDKMLKTRASTPGLPEFQKTQSNETHLILQSSTDLGVCRNGGRRGSSFAPEAILNLFKKITSATKSQLFFSQDVSCALDEEANFEKAQITQQNKISKLINNTNADHILHLGGGHDHVYPFLCSIAQKHKDKNIAIVNIDAHLDTRYDELKHSGTPFRQFVNDHPKSKLFQFGIHKYTNPSSNYENLNAEMKVTTSKEIQAMQINDFRKHIDNQFMGNDEMIWVLSLDSDALHSSIMEAVSAVNHNGLSVQQVLTIIDCVKKKQKNQKYFGIYEYNPLYDNLSQKGARTIVDLLTHWIL